MAVINVWGQWLTQWLIYQLCPAMASCFFSQKHISISFVCFSFKSCILPTTSSCLPTSSLVFYETLAHTFSLTGGVGVLHIPMCLWLLWLLLFINPGLPGWVISVFSDWEDGGRFLKNEGQVSGAQNGHAKLLNPVCIINVWLLPQWTSESPRNPRRFCSFFAFHAALLRYPSALDPPSLFCLCANDPYVFYDHFPLTWVHSMRKERGTGGVERRVRCHEATEIISITISNIKYLIIIIHEKINSLLTSLKCWSVVIRAKKKKSAGRQQGYGYSNNNSLQARWAEKHLNRVPLQKSYTITLSARE